MKLSAIVILLFLLLLPCYGIEREGLTFTNYDLDLRIEPQQQRLGVRGKITIRNDSNAPQKNFILQISSSLDWRSIRFKGQPVQFVSQPYTSDVDHTGGLSEAIVTLPSPVPPNGTIELEVGYEGVVPLDATRLTRIGVPQDQAKHADWDQISEAFTAVRGVGYVAWYPIAVEAASLSDTNSVFEAIGRWNARESGSAMNVNMCVEGESGSSLAIFTNAEDAGATGSSSDATCHRFKFQLEGTKTPSFAIGAYTVVDRQNVAIDYLNNHKSAADDYALATELVAPFVNEWFGPPREKLRVIDLVDAQAAPFESGSVLLAPLTASADTRFTQMTAVHQLTHSAFPSPRPWIFEGLGHFAQAAYQERQNGREAALEFMNLHLLGLADAEKALAAEQDPNERADQSLINTAIPDLYRSKAMYVWWMLRDMVGETTLKKALGQYRADQDKDASYMQKLVEAQSKRDLEWFFDDWVYRDRGLPDFRVESAFTRKLLSEGYIVTVTVENLGAAGAEVPVTLKMDGGDITKRLLVPAKGKASVRLEAASVPQQVVVNDGSVPESDMSNNSFQVPAPAK